MSRRYYVAAFGNFLGCIIFLGTLAVVLARPNLGPLCGMVFYFLGWGTYRFQTVMNEEFSRHD